MTGSSISEKEGYINTDLYVVRTDGTKFTQLTYHPGNDLSGVWSPEGSTIYFLSQRGSADKVYNVWKMSFPFYTYSSSSSRPASDYGTATAKTSNSSNTKRKTRR